MGVSRQSKTLRWACYPSTSLPSVSTATCLTGRGGMLKLYRACRNSPSLVSACLETKSDRSRVAAAGGAPVIVLYFPALSPEVWSHA